jgi:hypothetical protein
MPFRLEAVGSIGGGPAAWSSVLATNLTTNFPFLYFRDTNVSTFPQRFFRLAP